MFRQIIKLEPGTPLFKTDGINISVTIQLRNTFTAQQELKAAYQRGDELIARMIPGGPGILPDEHFVPAAEHELPGLSEPTPQTFVGIQIGPESHDESLNESVPERGGKKRGRSSGTPRGRGVSQDSYQPIIKLTFVSEFKSREGHQATQECQHVEGR